VEVLKDSKKEGRKIKGKNTETAKKLIKIRG
jgi:hypothetical protein